MEFASGFVLSVRLAKIRLLTLKISQRICTKYHLHSKTAFRKLLNYYLREIRQVINKSL